MSEFFPLYSDIICKCEGKKVTIKRKKNILKEIEELDHHTKELIYILIFSHSLKENSEDLFKCTRKINHDNTVDLTWNLNEVPYEICEMLEIFLEKEKKSKIEKIKREQIHLKMNLKLGKDLNKNE